METCGRPEGLLLACRTKEKGIAPSRIRRHTNNERKKPASPRMVVYTPMPVLVAREDLGRES